VRDVKPDQQLRRKIAAIGKENGASASRNRTILIIPDEKRAAECDPHGCPLGPNGLAPPSLSRSAGADEIAAVQTDDKIWIELLASPGSMDLSGSSRLEGRCSCSQVRVCPSGSGGRISTEVAPLRVWRTLSRDLPLSQQWPPF